MMIFAISIFFAFSNIAIFSYRLAHVAAALHPIMVAIIFKSIRKKERPKSQKILGIFSNRYPYINLHIKNKHRLYCL